MSYSDYGRFEVSHEDYQRMRSEDNFRKLVRMIINENEAVRFRAKRVEKGIGELINEIEKELEVK